MSFNFLLRISVTLLISILTIESVYNPFLYDDGNGTEEHCCVVPIRGTMCLATPITRSLIQVNKQCSRSERPRRRQSNKKKNQDEYLDKITRRLNVRQIHENDDRIFIELEKPLDKNILKNDLICLTSTKKHNINLEQCFVELVEEEDDDDEESTKRHNRRKNHGHLKNIENKKDSNDDEDDPLDDENEIRRIELNQPIRIREGRGFSFIRKYHIDRNQIRPKTSEQRQCWSWYRDQTRKLRKKLSTQTNVCFNLGHGVERCINQLIYKKFNDTNEIEDSKIPFLTGSKLYCKNHNNQNKLLGHYRRGKICFDKNDEIIIEHKFSDITRLSDQFKSQDTIKFIENNDKLTAEFQDDCHDEQNLVETNQTKNEEQLIQNSTQQE